MYIRTLSEFVSLGFRPEHGPVQVGEDCRASRRDAANVDWGMSRGRQGDGPRDRVAKIPLSQLSGMRLRHHSAVGARTGTRTKKLRKRSLSPRPVGRRRAGRPPLQDVERRPLTMFSHSLEPPAVVIRSWATTREIELRRSQGAQHGKSMIGPPDDIQSWALDTGK